MFESISATPISSTDRTFAPGTTYATRSICDSKQVIEITVAKRTTKTVTTSEGKTLRIAVRNGVERVMPWGRYSMAPTICADRAVTA